jgi:glucokinase
MTANLRLALVGDIGGTNARFAIADVDALTIAHFAVFPCARFPSLPAVIRSYLDEVPHRPTMASLAIAGPIREGVLQLTNLSWAFTRNELQAATGAEVFRLLNDFEALSLSLPHLTARDLHKIGGEESGDRATKAVLGPGTGLGVAGLLATPWGWVSLASEGGHVSFAAHSPDERAIIELIRRSSSHVSAERLISGPGLANVYQVLHEMRARPAATLSAPEVVRAAFARADPVAEEALGLFVRWLGRFAGDVGLMFGARGGVYLGGGIAPKILGALTTGAFRTAFQSKGRMSSYLTSMPVYVITAEDAGLRGAAAALSTTGEQTSVEISTT